MTTDPLPALPEPSLRKNGRCYYNTDTLFAYAITERARADALQEQLTRTTDAGHLLAERAKRAEARADALQAEYRERLRLLMDEVDALRKELKS